MKKNIGTTDKIIRILIATIAIIFIIAGIAKGLLAIILGIIAFAMIITSIFGYCALYKLIGFSSCPIKE